MQDIEQFIHYTLVGIQIENMKKNKETLKEVLNLILSDLQKVENLDDVKKVIGSIERMKGSLWITII